MTLGIQKSIKKIPLFEYAVISLLFFASYGFVFSALIKQWLADANYAHGIFIIPMALVLSWRRRRKYFAADVKAHSSGYVFLALGILLYGLGIMANEYFTTRVSMIFSLAGIIALTQGRERLRILLFPLAFLFFMIPLPYILYYKMTFPLQIKSSQIASQMLAWIGVPSQRHGNIIKLENYSLEIVTACSGLRSIMTLGALAFFMSGLMKLGRLKKLLLLLLAVPTAILANSIRLTATAMIAALKGKEAADGFLHEVSGILAFSLGFLILASFFGAMIWLERRRYS